MIDPPAFVYEDHPDHPGWKRWSVGEANGFTASLGELLVRVEGGTARVRMTPGRRHANLNDRVHGGALLGFIDVALFAGARAFGLVTLGSAVTLDVNTHFVAAGRLGEPLDARIELVRETGRLLFLRGLLVQAGDEPVAEFSGTIRKSGVK